MVEGVAFTNRLKYLVSTVGSNGVLGDVTIFKISYGEASSYCLTFCPKSTQVNSQLTSETTYRCMVISIGLETFSPRKVRLGPTRELGAGIRNPFRRVSVSELGSGRSIAPFPFVFCAT